MYNNPQEELLQLSNSIPSVIAANTPLGFQEQKIGRDRNYREA